MNKLISAKEAAAKIPDGATIFIGGYMGESSAKAVIRELLRSEKGGFTLLANDGGQVRKGEAEPYLGIAQLIHAGKVRKLIATHVGLNPEVSELVNQGKMELVLLPQGSFAEMIRSAGAGLGGVLTPTGVGTEVEKNEFTIGKQVIQGKEYLLMAPLRADVALINGTKIDKNGNIWYRGSTRTFSTVMVTAADLVIAEANRIVPVGEVAQENIMTPGVYVDYVVAWEEES
ncbi:MAG: CoA transferase subunit A [Parasporobacterium sp.]|nr:CoA transferase subunit A [Parasporobacterium sp.]